MDTEKATTMLDMPHAARQAAQERCVCGRTMADPLHQDEALPEIASSYDAVITEKGS
jgi:hypothetical protein